MKRLCCMTFLVLAASFAAGCGSASAPLGPAPQQSPVPASTGKPVWQQDWEKSLALANSEGKVVLLSSFGNDGNRKLAEAFKQRHGLDMEFVVGRSGEITTKVGMERRAGLYLEDVYLAGGSSIIEFRDLGYLDPVKPLVILPEVTDPKVWLDGYLRFIDKEGLLLAYQVEAVSPIMINTDMVKPDEIKSFRDLLNPRWKGKIVVQDPTMGSAGTSFFFSLWELMGPDFTRELAKQDLTITKDGRLQVEWLARGKYSISGTPSSDIKNEFIKAGAPVKVVQPAEGTLSSSSKGVAGVLNKAAHPNATRVFVNWLLTKEGQTVMSQVSGQSSRRLDVSHEWVDPSILIQPGLKYIEADTEESIQKKVELQTLSKDVWNVK